MEKEGVRMRDQWSDEFWYERLLNEDSAARPLNSLEKSSIINLCMQEAQIQKDKLEQRFGIRNAEAYIAEFGYQIEEEEPDLMPSFLYMGMMVPDERKIRLNRTVIRLLDAYMRERFPEDDERIGKLMEIIRFHELFHVVEEATEGIVTRNVRTPVRVLGMVWRNRKVEAASEIGAIHFSRLMTGASFPPGLYISYLLAATNQNADEDDEYRDSKKGRRE